LGFHNIFKVTNTPDAIKISKSNTIDLAFMDINIEGPTNGIECAKMLNMEYDIPIIFTTAYGDTQTISESRRTNLYGYLVKPFEIHDVEASIQVALKLLGEKGDKDILDYTIYLGKKQYYNLISKTLYIEKNQVVKLTNKESMVLDVFCHHLNQNISHEMLKVTAWGDENSITDSTLRDTIARLKKKVPALNITAIKLRKKE